MIRLGKQVTQAGDQLYDMNVKRLHKEILNPQSTVATLQRRLQAIRAMDPNQYRRLKVGLPYIVCAQFHPKIRRKENFVYTERFLLDIDHISEHGLSMDHLRGLFEKDERVELVFSSPSGDGLKVMLRLEGKVSDSNYYTVFYKAFCLSFGRQYQLGPALDHKTHDVSRCCFISYDPLAYYNPEARGINAGDHVREDDLFASDKIEKEMNAVLKENRETAMPVSSPQDITGQDLPSDLLQLIKEKVGQKVRAPKEKFYEQPEKLIAIVEEAKDQIEGVGAVLEKVAPISYGKQLRIKGGNQWAEVNVFYGKKGVSIVGTTKTGSNRELCNAMVELLKGHFNN